MTELTTTATDLLYRGWTTEEVRKHLRVNWLDATNSTIEEAISAAFPKAARQRFIDSFRDMQAQAFRIATLKGWHDRPRTLPEIIALIHSELSEALEAYRKGNPPDDKIPNFDGITAELADVIIRIMDTAEKFGLDVAQAVPDKMAFNAGREYRHGGKLL